MTSFTVNLVDLLYTITNGLMSGQLCGTFPQTLTPHLFGFSFYSFPRLIFQKGAFKTQQKLLSGWKNKQNKEDSFPQYFLFYFHDHLINKFYRLIPFSLTLVADADTMHHWQQQCTSRLEWIKQVTSNNDAWRNVSFRTYWQTDKCTTLFVTLRCKTEALPYRHL